MPGIKGGSTIKQAPTYVPAADSRKRPSNPKPRLEYDGVVPGGEISVMFARRARMTSSVTSHSSKAQGASRAKPAMCDAALASEPPRVDMSPGYGLGLYLGLRVDSWGAHDKYEKGKRKHHA